MESKQFLLIFLIFLSFVAVTINWSTKPISPCPRMFQYIKLPVGTEWIGLLSWRYGKSFENPKEEHVTMTFCLPEQPLNNYVGNVELLNDNLRLYKINFPSGRFLPKLLEIRVNREIICKGFERNELAEPFVYTLEYREYLNHVQDNLIYDENDESNVEDGTEEDSFNHYDDLLTLTETSCGTVHHTKRFQVLAALKKQMSSSYYSKKPSTPCSRTLGNRADTHNGAHYESGDFWRVTLVNNTTTGEEDYSELDAIFFNETETLTRGAWPWMAAIYTHNLTSMVYQCGGTLVSSRVVLSAAHCLFKSTKGDILVLLGRFNLKNWDEKGSVAASVNDLIIHPDFVQDPQQSDANIAIIKLAIEVKFSAYIEPACLGYNNHRLLNSEGDLGVVLSWMTAKQSMGRSLTIPKLIGAIIPVTDNHECPLKGNRSFCAKDILITARFHSNDMGAGFLLHINKRWFLKGILTAVSDVCNKPQNDAIEFKKWAILTDVTKVLNWIYNHIENEDKENKGRL